MSVGQAFKPTLAHCYAHEEEENGNVGRTLLVKEIEIQEFIFQFLSRN